jgi:AAA domain
MSDRQEEIERLAREMQNEAEAEAARARRANGPNAQPDEPPKENGPDGQQLPSGLVMVRAADVTPVAVDWIWDGRIARGKQTIVAGAPDVGKSQIGAYIAARITKRERWPNGALAPQGDVVILASEDAIDDTWVPRLMAAGADLARVHFVKMVIDERGKRRTFNLQEDLEALAEKLCELDKPQLVIIDPITSYLGKVDAHRTPDVRAVMEPVTALAERCRVGIFAVTHPPKAQGTAMNAFTGSMAFVASARIAFIVVDEPETERRLMLEVKNNVGIKAQGRGYTIEGTKVAEGIIAPRIIWDDAPVDMTADQAIVAAAKHAKEGGRTLKEAIEFLRQLLADGPMGATDAEEAAEKEGIRERTLRRARKELGVIAKKDDFAGGWSWSL